MEGNVSSAFEASEEQAMAVFNHAAEEIRFFKGQQWSVTNYALAAYAALAAAPDWMEPFKVSASRYCAIAVKAFCSSRGLPGTPRQLPPAPCILR